MPRPAPARPAPSRPTVDAAPSAAVLPVPGTRPDDPVVVQRGQPGARHRRPGPGGRPEQEHHLPVRGHAGQARLPAAGPGDEASTRSARAWSTSASPRSTPWRSPGSPRATCRRCRTRPATPSAWPCSTAPTSSTSTAGAAAAASQFAMGLQPARRLAAAGVLHLDGQGAARLPRAGRAAGAARPDRPGPPRAQDDHRPRAADGRAGPGPPHRHRGQRRGAGAGPALGRRAGARPVRPGGRRRSTSPST